MEAIQEQCRLSGALQRMLNQALSAGFETWQANAAEGKDAEQKLRKGLMRMVLLSLRDTKPQSHGH